MTGYEIVLDGHLDDRWCGWAGGDGIRRTTSGATVLALDGVDQARLHGALGRVRDLGARVLSIRMSDDASPVLTQRLRTDRLLLRAATPDDAEAVWRYRRLPEVAVWMTASIERLEEFREQFVLPDRLARTVAIELSGELIGDLMLRREDAWAQAEVAEAARGVQAEVGWALDPAHAGQGYATEAVRELLRHAFDDLGLRRVVAECFAANAPSWRLMERVGMRREHHAVRDALHRSGEWMDSYTYALLAEEWRAERT